MLCVQITALAYWRKFYKQSWIITENYKKVNE